MTPTRRLRDLLARPGLRVMPCCFDALSAKLVEDAGFELTFMSGFAVSAARLALPDTGLVSYGEMVDQARAITAAVRIPVIGDGDTGYGNAMNVKRTARGYAAAGLACVMIEDQVAPKRCGHTRGKRIVPREEAFEPPRRRATRTGATADAVSVSRAAAADTRSTSTVGPFWGSRLGM